LEIGEVVGILFRKLLEPEYKNGALLDGFPRTKVQVGFLKLLFDEMIALRREFSGTVDEIHFKKPMFHIMVLFVDEAESVARQLKRGRQVVAHNEEVTRSGVGELWEERATDSSEALARNRYRVFKEKTYDALVSLKQIFHYHFVNGQAPIPEVQANIVRELEYQSSLELDPRTFDRLRRLPLASDIVRHARQDLVRLLDGYEVERPETFGRVIEFIEAKMMPHRRSPCDVGRGQYQFGRRFVSGPGCLDDADRCVLRAGLLRDSGCHPSLRASAHRSPEREDFLRGEEGLPFKRTLQKRTGTRLGSKKRVAGRQILIKGGSKVFPPGGLRGVGLRR
jgi:adenylate kinase family enzyme